MHNNSDSRIPVIGMTAVVCYYQALDKLFTIVNKIA